MVNQENKNKFRINGKSQKLKGDRANIGDYHPISLNADLHKLFSKFIRNRCYQHQGLDGKMKLENTWEACGEGIQKIEKIGRG